MTQKPDHNRLSLIAACAAALALAVGGDAALAQERPVTDREAISAAAGALRACVQSPDLVRVSVRVTVAASGDVDQVRVEGPLSPEEQRCVAHGFSALTLAPRARTQSLTFPVTFAPRS